MQAGRSLGRGGHGGGWRGAVYPERRKIDKYLGLQKDDPTLQALYVPLMGRFDEGRSVHVVLGRPPHESLEREVLTSGDDWFEQWGAKRSVPMC